MTNEANNVATNVPEVNDVTIQGVIVHKFVTPQIAILTIRENSTASFVNYPKILFFGDLRKTVEEQYENGNHVTITGNIQSSRRKPGVAKQTMQSIFGESITFTPSIMKTSFGVENAGSYKPYKNEVKLVGRVSSIEHASQNIIRIVIRTVKNKHISYVRLVYYTKRPTETLSTIQYNDTVCVLGRMRTSKKEKEDTLVYYEDCVVLDIKKLEAAQPVADADPEIISAAQQHEVTKPNE